MKQLFFLLATAGFLTSAAQTITAPEGFAAGYYINTSNERVEGFIKESFKKGSIQFIAPSGTKKSFTPAEINEVSISGTTYIAYMNDFYKLTSTGSKGSLLQKATNNSGKMLYNGNEAFSATTPEGKPGDYYIRVNSNNQVELVTKENFQEVFTASCADCVSLVAIIKARQLDYGSIEKAMEQYNNCK